MIQTTTPKKITPEILTLCLKISNQKPVYISCCPALGATKGNCFINLQNFIDSTGGEVQHGWIIWEWPGILLEAEFHGVWKKKGSLIDITPHDGEKKILFLPDPQKRFTGLMIPNIMEACSSEPLVQEYITKSAEMNTLRAKLFAEKRDPIDEEQMLISKVAMLHYQIFEMLGLNPVKATFEALGMSISSEAAEQMKIGRNAPCPCGSGLKYKKCCMRK